MSAALNKDVVKPWKKKAGTKKPAKVAFKVDAAKLKTTTQAYIHAYLKATVMQAKGLLKTQKALKAKKKVTKKTKKLIKAMEKLVKKSKTKLNEAKDE